jgi:ankyrin repeat protein
MSNSQEDGKKKPNIFKRCFKNLWVKLFNDDVQKINDAIKQGNLEKIIMYHKVKELDFHEYNEQGDTPILTAARHKKLNILKYITKAMPEVREDKSIHGDTALMIAVFQGNFRLSKFLAEEAGLNINTRDHQGYTPFIAACANGFLELVIYFMCILKVDTSIKGYNKQSAIHRAAYYGESKVIRILKRYTKLRFDQPDKRGNTPFHLAAMGSHFQTIRIMLEFVKFFRKYSINPSLDL